MRRTLFFILEKLEIKKSERIAMSALLISLAVISAIWTFQQPSANYDEKEYQKLEKIFEEKSQNVQEERDLILARYESNKELPAPGTPLTEANMTNSVKDTTGSEPKETSSGDLLNINTATNTQLQELPGIGPAYARRIVEWREQNGIFTSKDQLLEIKGIGEKRLARIKPLIRL